MNTLPTVIPEATTAGGLLLVLMLVLPLIGVFAALILGGRDARRVAMLAIPAGLALAVAIEINWCNPATRWSICWVAGRRRLALPCAPTASRRP